ncbi:hypothetical protein [Chamaesiphon sp. VAR_48_metabat_135_sub]|uniref:hypothetical protein n=1 Tax=Chamaesiphon sp. VAR_48_metabat_135_sub TaxID=2964699 RepID=UPI00286BE4A7|nr:hypothetical protein [Chamaesiphon sp. VAR_48_metabat_135_sub]
MSNNRLRRTIRSKGCDYSGTLCDRVLVGSIVFGVMFDLVVVGSIDRIASL